MGKGIEGPSPVGPPDIVPAREGWFRDLAGSEVTLPELEGPLVHTGRGPVQRRPCRTGGLRRSGRSVHRCRVSARRCLRQRQIVLGTGSRGRADGNGVPGTRVCGSHVEGGSFETDD